jgi:purine-binding chemotaxis protein CheW
MKNVIVFALGGARFAAELRWVREVITLGFVTPVPRAPAIIAGVVNLRGSITPVFSLDALDGTTGTDHPPPRQGDGAVLLDVEGVTAAIRVDKVDEVSTLSPNEDGSLVVDTRGREIPLIDPPAMFEAARAATESTRELSPLPGAD